MAEPLPAAIGLSPAQRQAAKFLSRCDAETVCVTVFGQADAGAVQAHRAALARNADANDAPTITHYLLAALARTLAEHPVFNAHFVDGELQHNHAVDIALAVAMPNGDLVMPVVREVDRKPLRELHRECDTLVERVRAGGMTLKDTRGATFTLSNLGRPEVPTHATPVIPVPQVAILAVTAIRQTPVVRDGAIVIADMLPLSLSFDHRVINGVAANQFLDRLGEWLARPDELEEAIRND